MPGSTSVLLGAVGPQAGYGQPFAGPYSNVYGVDPKSQTAQDQYWQSLDRGYQNQQQQLVRDAFDVGVDPSLQGYDWRSGIQYDPTTGKYTFDRNKIQNPKGVNISEQDFANMQTSFERGLVDTNEDRVQARQQLEGLAQQRSAQEARLAQQGAETAGFQKELSRYDSPDLMRQMINPQLQQMGNQVMASANAAGQMGGSMGQAANRRAAMTGFGQGASQVVPQAAVAQAGQNFTWQKAREGMINNYYQQQQERAQRDLQNQLGQSLFLKGFEEYEHNRSNETLAATGDVLKNFGAAGAAVAPSFGGGGK